MTVTLITCRVCILVLWWCAGGARPVPCGARGPHLLAERPRGAGEVSVQPHDCVRTGSGHSNHDTLNMGAGEWALMSGERPMSSAPISWALHCRNDSPRGTASLQPDNRVLPLLHLQVPSLRVVLAPGVGHSASTLNQIVR